MIRKTTNIYFLLSAGNSLQTSAEKHGIAQGPFENVQNLRGPHAIF